MDNAKISDLIHSLHSRISAIEDSHTTLSGKGNTYRKDDFRNDDTSYPYAPPRYEDPVSKTVTRRPYIIQNDVIVSEFYNANNSRKTSAVRGKGAGKWSRSGWELTKIDDERTTIIGHGYNENQLCTFIIVKGSRDNLKLTVDNPSRWHKVASQGSIKEITDYLEIYFR
jgi:hypothetical protein